MRATILSVCVLLFSCIASATNAGAAAVVPSASSTLCNVKDFGAVGDGMTDDTFALLNAMNNCALPAGGVALMYFPVGVYNIVSNASSTFEFAFFFQDCSRNSSSSQNAVSFVGEVSQDGVRPMLSWQVADDLRQQATLFTVIECSNFAISNIELDVYSPAALAPPIIVNSQSNSFVTISSVSWQVMEGSAQGLATAFSFNSVSNILLENSMLSDLSIEFSECTEVIALQLTLQTSSTPSNSEAVNIQGGFDFHFANLDVSGYATGLVFWSEIPLNAAFRVSESTFNVNQPIIVYNDINLTVTASSFISPQPSNSSVGIGITLGALPCVSITSSTFNNFSVAAIQNDVSPLLVKSIQGTSQKAHFTRNNGTCTFLTVEQSNFISNSLDLQLEAASWQLQNNICSTGDASQLQCSSNNCKQSNNQGCDFALPSIGSTTSEIAQPRRPSLVILRED